MQLDYHHGQRGDHRLLDDQQLPGPQKDTQIADGLSALLAGVTSSCSTGVGLTASLVTAAEVTFADVGGNDYQIPGITDESWADYDSELQYMLIYANEPCISNAGGEGHVWVSAR